jgi:PKD repeat protein
VYGAAGGSGRGDAIFGFLQGDGPNTQIAAVVVRAPPGEFVTNVPNGWVKAARIPFQWEAPLAGAGAVSYSILVDDQEVAEGVTGTEYTLSREQAPNGIHTIQVQATDSLGQVVDSSPATLKIERKPPRVRVSVRGASVTVRVSDEPQGESPGVKRGSVKVSFGDGGSGRGRTTLTHTYSRAGSYTVLVSASDKAGNKTTIRKLVRVA